MHCCQLRGYRLSLFPQPFFGLFQRCRWKLYSGLMFATRTYVSFNKLPKSHRFAWVGHLAAAVMAACTVHSPLSHWPLTTHPEVPEANLHLQHVSDWQPACVLCMCAGCYSRHKMPQVLQVRTSHGRSRDTLSLDVVGSLDAFSCRAGSRRVAPGRALISWSLLFRSSSRSVTRCCRAWRTIPCARPVPHPSLPSITAPLC